MIESLDELEENAEQELKRADHLLYVTLKYTRTADVIKNTIKRLINAFNFTILECLEYLKTKKKIKEIPGIDKLRAEYLAKMISEFKDDIDFYFLLKKIDKAEFTKREEYRKKVTLILKFEFEDVEVNTDILKEYFQRTKNFVHLVENLIKEKE